MEHVRFKKTIEFYCYFKQVTTKSRYIQAYELIKTTEQNKTYVLYSFYSQQFYFGKLFTVLTL